jgi:hypothetical protein
MQYPNNTNSKPVTGEEARTLLAAMERGEARCTPESERTVARILARRGMTFVSGGHDERAVSQRRLRGSDS